MGAQGLAMDSQVMQQVKAFYTEKLREHGATHLGVDWNSPESQALRFEQLLKCFDLTQPFTINDYGCGYGALVNVLRQKNLPFTYHGYDITEGMITQARSLYPDNKNIRFHLGNTLEPADYTVASGVFNLKLETPTDTWESSILQNLHAINNASLKGFAFNILSLYSDAPLRKDYLYYGDPCFYFDYAKQHFSKQVALLHNYGVYEFTLVVNKD